MKGYNERTNLYTSRYYASRYYARKYNPGMVIVKVYGGYTAMPASEYNVWRKQK